MDAYDDLFYDSLCIPATDPERLAVLGRLFGLATADPASCRVLELGAATGGNLIPMAARLPGAHFVGIDLSAAQVAAGAGLIDRLGLDNIALRHGDIAALPADLGRFDYVIAHGVYSWVPPATAAALLAAARRLLAPGGVAYVSLNTLPGWRLRGMLRDLLLDATRAETTPAARLAAAEAALDRLARGLGPAPDDDAGGSDGVPGLAAEYLRAELARLRGLPASYLYHELLADEHHPVLFRDFVAAATAAGLAYLCDCDLATQFPARLGGAADAALADLTDGVDVEQWLDFLGTRGFRQAVLYRDDAVIDDGLSLARFAELALWADLLPGADAGDGHADGGDAGGNAAARFQTAAGEPIEVHGEIARRAVRLLARRYPEAIPLPRLLAEAAGQAGGADAPALEAALQELFALYLRGAVGARVAPRSAPVSGAGNDPNPRPRASALVRALAAAGEHRLPTRDHRSLPFDPVTLRLIARMDGTRDLRTLAAALPGVSAGAGAADIRRLLAVLGRYGMVA